MRRRRAPASVPSRVTDWWKRRGQYLRRSLPSLKLPWSDVGVADKGGDSSNGSGGGGGGSNSSNNNNNRRNANNGSGNDDHRRNDKGLERQSQQ